MSAARRSTDQLGTFLATPERTKLETFIALIVACQIVVSVATFPYQHPHFVVYSWTGWPALVASLLLALLAPYFLFKAPRLGLALTVPLYLAQLPVIFWGNSKHYAMFFAPTVRFTVWTGPPLQIDVNLVAFVVLVLVAIASRKRYWPRSHVPNYPLERTRS